MSTSHTLIELVEEIISSLDNNKYAIGIFVDLKNAFDTVNHNILANILCFYGIRGVAHKWIMSYLENRSEFVHCENCDSEVLKICCGVPQGSVLGPKLFILYINDICNVLKMFKFILFADDTNMFYSNSDIADLARLTNIELEKLHVWFAVNRLSLNISKTNCIFFGNRILKTHVSIQIRKDEIRKVEFTKYLGVLIENKLTWKNTFMQSTTQI